MYCQAYASYIEACEKVNAQGPLQKDKQDRVFANPYVAARDQASKTMLELASELGIAPGSGSMLWPTAVEARQAMRK